MQTPNASLPTKPSGRPENVAATIMAARGLLENCFSGLVCILLRNSFCGEGRWKNRWPDRMAGKRGVGG